MASAITTALNGQPKSDNETCLSCPARLSDVPCTHVQKCSSGQQCFARILATPSGDLLHEYGCKDSQLCGASSLFGRREAAMSMTSRQTQSGFQLCERCCSGTICNMNMCGQAPNISGSNGPICYSCSNHTTQDSCTDIQHCPTGQVCQLVPNISLASHKIHFESSCAVNAECQTKIATLTNGILGRKRDMPCSMRCCNTTLCNQLSCGQVTTPAPLPMDCKDIINRPHLFSNRGDGVYTIMLPRSRTVLQVFCNMTHGSGGWTVVFQRRVSSSPDFNRSMAEYEKGFGNILSDFWMGLEYLKEITDLGPSDEKYHVTNVYNDNSTMECHFSFRIISLSGAPSFTLARESSNTAASCSGDMSMVKTHLDYTLVFPPIATFATYDRDTTEGCAAHLGGGWWYYGCIPSNVPLRTSSHTGVYRTCGSHFYPGVPLDKSNQDFECAAIDFNSGRQWQFSAKMYSLTYIDMMIRRNN